MLVMSYNCEFCNRFEEQAEEASPQDFKQGTCTVKILGNVEH